MTATNLMLLKIEAAIARNQRAMIAAAEKGRPDVAELCGGHHFRLRKVEDYLIERLTR